MKRRAAWLGVVVAVLALVSGLAVGWFSLTGF